MIYQSIIGPDAKWWSGGTDKDSEDIFYWQHSRQNLTFDKWNYGDPSGDKDENCLLLLLLDHWQDYPCSDEYSFICEKQHADSVHQTMTYLYLMAKLLEIFSEINSGLDQENNFFFKLHIFLLLNADNVLQTIPFCFVFYSKICGKMQLNSQRVTKLNISKEN